MTLARQLLGKEAEALAEQHLVQSGLRITHRRYRNRFGEIDLIARDGEVTVFVEVKAKRDYRQGSPEEMVHAVKQRKLIGAIRWFLMEVGREIPVRVDVIAVDYSQGKTVIRHHRHAFEITF